MQHKFFRESLKRAMPWRKAVEQLIANQNRGICVLSHGRERSAKHRR